MSRRTVVPSLKKHRNGTAYCKWRGVFHYFGTWEKPDVAKWKRFLHEIDAGCHDEVQTSPRKTVKATSATVSDLIAAYVSEKERQYQSPEHAENLRKYRFRWKHAYAPLLKLHGGTLITEFGPKAFKEVRRRLVQPGRSRTYINDLACEIRLAFQWGVTDELVPVHVFNAIKLVKVVRPGEFDDMPEGREVKPVPFETVQATLPFLDPKVAAIVELMTMTVSRPGEIARLKAEDIDKNGPDGKWVYWLTKHKTAWKGKKRFIMFNEQAQEVLTRHWIANGPLFVNDKTGLPYTSEQVRKAVDFACKRAGIAYWFPYQIRHSTYSKVSEEHGEAAAVLLGGHSSTRMAERYDHSRVKKAAKFAG